jgi:hypothetical protein
MTAEEFPDIPQKYHHVVRGVTQAQRAGLLSKQQLTAIVDRLRAKAQEHGDLDRAQPQQDDSDPE